MALTKSKLDSVNKIAEKVFESTFGANDKSTYQNYTRVISGIKGTSYEGVFLTSLGSPREFIGSRVINRPRANNLVIPVKPYEKSQGIDGLLVRQDKGDVVAGQIQAFMAGQAGYYDGLIFKKLIDGLTEDGYDAVAFFSTAHPFGPDGTTQSNLGASLSLDSTNLNTVTVAMAGRVGEDNEPLNIIANKLIVGPKLANAARQLVESPLAVDGSTNSQAGLLELVIDTRLVGSYDDYWFVVCDNKGVDRPMILAEARALEPKVEESFMSDEVYVGLDCDLAIGFGAWQLIYACGTTV